MPVRSSITRMRNGFSCAWAGAANRLAATPSAIMLATNVLFIAVILVVNFLHRTTFAKRAVVALMHIGCAFSHVVASRRRSLLQPQMRDYRPPVARRGFGHIVPLAITGRLVLLILLALSAAGRCPRSLSKSPKERRYIGGQHVGLLHRREVPAFRHRCPALNIAIDRLRDRPRRTDDLFGKGG